MNRVCHGRKDERNPFASEINMDRNRFPSLNYMLKGMPKGGMFELPDIL